MLNSRVFDSQEARDHCLLTITSIWTLFPKYSYIFKNILTLCVVFLFCFAWACVPFIASFFRLSTCVCPFGILYFLFTVSLNCPFVLAPSVFSNLNFLIRLVKRGRGIFMNFSIIWFYNIVTFCLYNEDVIDLKYLLLKFTILFK